MTRRVQHTREFLEPESYPIPGDGQDDPVNGRAISFRPSGPGQPFLKEPFFDPIDRIEDEKHRLVVIDRPGVVIVAFLNADGFQSTYPWLSEPVDVLCSWGWGEPDPF